MQPLNKKEADRLKNLASIAGVTTSILLSSLKLFASIYTGSLSVLSSLIDSLSDVLGSFITFIAVRFSSKPATHTYRYGYGKVESLSALFQSVFIAMSGLYVLIDGIRRFVNPQPIEQTDLGLLVMGISLACTLILITFLSYVIKKTKSQAIKGESAHYVVDILTNISIILTLAVVKIFGWMWFDTLIAVVISIFLLFNAYSLGRDAIRTILDKELDEKIREDIKKIVMSCPQTKGIHDLRTRDIGGVYTFEFHLEMDGKMPLGEAHDCSNHVEETLIKKYPNAQVIIHQEPAGIQDERLDNQVKKS